jgi:hypothetical protein
LLIEALAAKGRGRFREGIEMVTQFLPERAEPQLAEDEEPCFCSDVISEPQ